MPLKSRIVTKNSCIILLQLKRTQHLQVSVFELMPLVQIQLLQFPSYKSMGYQFVLILPIVPYIFYTDLAKCKRCSCPKSVQSFPLLCLKPAVSNPLLYQTSHLLPLNFLLDQAGKAHGATSASNTFNKQIGAWKQCILKNLWEFIDNH